MADPHTRSFLCAETSTSSVRCIAVAMGSAGAHGLKSKGSLRPTLHAPTGCAKLFIAVAV